jgi:hypothetical protein
MSRHVQSRWLEIEHAENSIYVYQKRNRKPLWELRRNP